MFRSKSIVLSDIENTNKKAVLSLEETELGVEGTLRLYNFSTEISGVASLGFYVNKKVYKSGLTQRAQMFYGFHTDFEQIPNQFSCALVNFQDAQAKPILFGTSDGSGDEVYANIITKLSVDNSQDKTQKTLDEFGVDFNEQEKEAINNEINKNLCQECNNCRDCIYKQYFYENIEIKGQKIHKTEIDGRELEEQEVALKTSQKQNDQHFVEKLKPQIEKLFEKHPIEANLQKLIPDSKWIKIEYEDDGDFYVFGLLYEKTGDIKYVCYGIPAVFEENPPQELSGYPVWIPLDKENAQGFGYWLTYQDASTGEPIKAIID